MGLGLAADAALRRCTHRIHQRQALALLHQQHIVGLIAQQAFCALGRGLMGQQLGSAQDLFVAEQASGKATA